MHRKSLLQRIAGLILLTSLLAACRGESGDAPPPSPPPPASPLPPASLPSINLADVSATDVQTSVSVSVWLSAASTSPVTVVYATLDGTAKAGVDYISTSGQLNFAAGTLSQSVSIPLIDGRDTSTTKSFHLQLSAPVNATMADTTAIITLTGSTTSDLFYSPVYSANWGSKGVFSAAQQCAGCHTGNSTVMNHSGKDVSPSTTWKHSVMAHAVDDPYFQAAVEEETHVFPHLKGMIEDTCTRCHAPMGHTHFHQTKTDPAAYYSFDQAMTENIGREGVSCTACHQMKDINLGSTASMSGHFTLNSEADRDVNGKLPAYGPFANPLGSAMQNQTQYTPTYPSSAHMSESKMCATCHNLYTPTIGLDGIPVKVVGTDTLVQFAEQTPYWEWLNSDYGRDKSASTYQTCQNCHMAEPAPGYATVISTKPDKGNLPVRTPFAVHDMVGGNTQLLEMLKTYMDILGIANSTTAAGFEAKIIESRAMLAKAASLAVGLPTNDGSTLTVPVTITNLTGHKLPTSYPSRRMWLHVTVKNESGAVIFESGKADANGRIALDEHFTEHGCLDTHKSDDFTNEGCYEPHRDVITSADQVAIYESVLGDVNGDITHVLLHGRQYLKDNRIPPKGYLKSGLPVNPAETSKVDADIIGVNLSTDTNFATGFTSSGASGQDTVTYKAPVTRAGTYTVQAELLYQSTRPSFVEGLHADDEITGESYVRRFKTMYAAIPPKPEVMATASR